MACAPHRACSSERGSLSCIMHESWGETEHLSLIALYGICVCVCSSCALLVLCVVRMLHEMD